MLTSHEMFNVSPQFNMSRLIPGQPILSKSKTLLRAYKSLPNHSSPTL